MRRVCIAAILAGLAFTARVDAQMLTPGSHVLIGVKVSRINKKLAGSLVDFTDNSFHDRRFYSQALQAKRDMYVYLPPAYDPNKRYPLMICLHGFNQDECNFLDVAEHMDGCMKRGELPPMIVAAPDGAIGGRPGILRGGSFYMNSNAGRFEDYIADDVYDFMCNTFPILPGKESHILSGVSMGGYGAINIGIKHRERFGLAIGIMPPLNSRYIDCNGRYFGDFDPSCFRYDETHKPHQVIARFYGIVTVRKKMASDPLFGRGPDVVARISMENAVEQIERYNLKNGELDMFVCYGKKDQFNIDAHVESFLYVARRRGIDVTAYVNPTGGHDIETGASFLPHISKWIKERVPNVNEPCK